MLLAATFCIFTNANALVKEVELPLFAYHIDNNATYRETPNKLDANAVFVANPGILLGLDSRKDAKTDGLSFLAKGGFLQYLLHTVTHISPKGKDRQMLSSSLWHLM